MNKNPLVSVVITSLNEESLIGSLLKSIKNQAYANFEIILVDNNSTDKTVEIAQSQGLKIFNFGPERSAQRNFGAKKAKGKYLLFLDADMELSDKVIKDCVEICEKNRGYGGVIIPEIPVGHKFWEKVKGFERSFYNEGGDEYTDAARFFTKEAFNKIGGYDEAITGPEDWDLSENVRNLGYKLGRASANIYHTERINSLFNLAKKKFYYALKAHRYVKKQKLSSISPKTIYFLRPIFYRKWQKIILHPLLTFGMVIMLSVELISGGMGYLIGKFKKL